MYIHNRTNKKSFKKGFTLVELLVSIAIFTIITSVAIVSNSKFDSSILLSNLAYEVALSIRQAQFYGISVRQSVAGSGAFDARGYGVHFDLNNNKQYIVFADKDNDEKYTNSDVVVDTLSIGRGNYISKLCVKSGTGCLDVSVNNPLLDIVFVRPDPDALIHKDGESKGQSLYANAWVCISSPQGPVRKVVIQRSGQISVKNETCS